MRSQDSWSCLAVEEFFSRCLWQGQLLENPNSHYRSLNWQQAVSPQLVWQRCSVEKFFSHCSWQGQPPESRNSHHGNSHPYLKQVREFFQFIAWEGSPEIGSLPKISPVTNLDVLVSEKTTILELSQLF